MQSPSRSKTRRKRTEDYTKQMRLRHAPEVQAYGISEKQIQITENTAPEINVTACLRNHLNSTTEGEVTEFLWKLGQP